MRRTFVINHYVNVTAWSSRRCIGAPTLLRDVFWWQENRADAECGVHFEGRRLPMAACGCWPAPTASLRDIPPGRNTTKM
jgi:hypothetical protein